MQIETSFPLGIKAQDKVTGFSGTLTRVSITLDGLISYLIEGRADNNRPAQAIWVSENRVEYSDKTPSSPHSRNR